MAPADGGKALKLGLATDDSGWVNVYDGADLNKDLVKAINGVIRKGVLRLGAVNFCWSTLQLNLSTQSKWHMDRRFKEEDKDKAAFRAVLALGLGDYEDGEFQLHGHRPIDLQYRAIIFDKTAPHRTLPAIGKSARSWRTWCRA